MNKNPMTTPIDDRQGIKPAVVFDIPGPDEIGLVNIIDPQGFLKVGIFDPLGAIRGFF
jgi:hypothetical protein